MKRSVKRRPAKRKKSAKRRKNTAVKKTRSRAGKATDKHTDSKPKVDTRFKKGNRVAEKYWWKPGQSGNPKGKPKGVELTTSLKKILDQPVHKVPFIKAQCERLGIELDPKDKKTKVLEVLMAATVTQLFLGKGDILKQIWERLEGSVASTLHLKDGDPFDDYLAAMKGKTTFDQMKGRG